MATMAATRKQIIADLKYQNFPAKKPITAGKKPLPEPTTVGHVFVMIAMHLCRKIVLFDPNLKVPFYLAALLCGSLVCDFTPFPRTYLGRKTNVFNLYFVKWGWAWTLISVGAFLGLSAYVYCCGNKLRIRRHFYRLLIGTAMWFCWTKSFVLLESYTAGCLNDKYQTRISCLKNGSTWKGFDISGHAFLLIYCSLLIAEEAKAIRGWERIGELIRNEEFDEESPLKPLLDPERKNLQASYDKFTPYVRLSFIVLTLFSILWDVMLVSTIIYFHSMIQKVIGGVIAILMWYATYRWWYNFPSSPGLPGQGSFKYCDIYMQPSAKKT